MPKVKKLKQFDFDYKRAAALIIRYKKHLYPPSNQIINKYQVFKDDSKVWRIKTRLQDADLPYETKNPIWIPYNSEITKKMIFFYHTSNNHPSSNITTLMIKDQFWISYRKVKSTVKSLNFKIFNAKPFNNAEFASYSNTRTLVGKPFEHVGLDIAGPIHTKEEDVYFLIITCFKTRAAHLELCESIKSEEIIFTIH